MRQAFSFSASEDEVSVQESRGSPRLSCVCSVNATPTSASKQALGRCVFFDPSPPFCATGSRPGHELIASGERLPLRFHPRLTDQGPAVVTHVDAAC